ncbi:MAG: hypothetical protein AUI17_07975 [Acidobacteriales bacterium 13_2_20CM_2_55_5]|nr:MAG: hypothetical protein AUI17_07975 [Acidobacteriales bacterium 13_2_20CM_2_55_5]OLD16156.1 MAG: hypothetical protein AUI85_10015 [Acidobacteriales bacterium 13_1_40CM_3_55_5]
MQAIAFALVLSTASGAVGLEATVSGTVTDSTGSESAHALVQAMLRTKSESGGIVGDHPNPWIEADDHGRFRINLPPGRYKFLAKNEIDGYPDPIFLLNSDETATFPEVTVSQKHLSGVRVTLGRRGGVLEGELIDQRSREPIPRCKIMIRDARNPDAYVEVFADQAGRFRFAIPSKPVLISATAPGYKTTKIAKSELMLSGGEHRSIGLRLEAE